MLSLYTANIILKLDEFVHSVHAGYPTLSSLTLIEWQNRKGEKELLRIKQSICSKWREVGILLQIDPSLLDGWEKQYIRDSVECCNAVLSYWLNNPCDSYPCTWDGVCRLLDHAQFGQIAAELKEALKIVSSSN